MRKLFLTSVVIYVVSFVFGFLFHNVLLGNDYATISAIMRPKSERGALMPYMFLGQLFWACGVAWLYSKSVENGPWVGQGIRFGLGVAAVAAVPIAFGLYAMQPWPGMLMIKGTIADIMTNLLIGLVAAYIYRSEAATPLRSASAPA